LSFKSKDGFQSKVGQPDSSLEQKASLDVAKCSSENRSNKLFSIVLPQDLRLCNVLLVSLTMAWKLIKQMIICLLAIPQ